MINGFILVRAFEIESDVTGSACHRAQQIEKFYVGPPTLTGRHCAKRSEKFYVGLCKLHEATARSAEIFADQ